MMRIGEIPPIEVDIVDSDELPSGMGEPPFSPLAPAMTNALFAATGVRHRTLPLTGLASN
jgi:isoquinoline 1-oxidoreductase subunit beta